MKKIKTPTAVSLARLLRLWPGLIALLSLLVLWGEGVRRPEGGRPLLLAGQAAQPELRAVPTPTPGPGLLGSPEAEPDALWAPPEAQAEPALGQAQRGPAYPDLRLLGRLQLDGA